MTVRQQVIRHARRVAKQGEDLSAGWYNATTGSPEIKGCSKVPGIESGHWRLYVDAWSRETW